MQESDLPGLTARVLWAGFAVAAAFGAIAQRTQFCTMGALADLTQFGDSRRLRMWLLAMAVAALGFNAMVAAGWLEARDSLYAAPRMPWLSNAVGGLMFGFGMVLASGCGSKTLVRAGGGNLKSLVVFAVLAIAAFATLKGLTAVWRVATVDAVAVVLPPGQDLPSLLSAASGLPAGVLALALGLLFAGAIAAWVLSHPDGRTREVWFAGLGIGATVVAWWWVAGRLGHLQEHPLTLDEAFIGSTSAQRMDGLSFVAPLAHTLDWLILFSDRSKVLTLGVVSTFGVVAGSALAALAGRSFRWEGFGGAEDTANHLVGATLMGVGGVTALGCTIGQGLSGISTLSLGSFVAVAGIFGGALLALRWQSWRLDRQP